ncbi:MAG: GlsB/YeaQ/YmgE family stress response membrane protein [Patescibacteria group bacterium]
MLLNLIIWLVFGAIVGWVASLIMGTDAQQGTTLNIIVGIVGAVLGGWIMNAFGQSGTSGFNIYSFIVALIGAIVLLGVVRLVRRA